MSRLAIAMGLFLASSAQASSFGVSPTQVSLSTTAPSSMVTIRNQGQERKRFQLAAFSWRQKPSGELELEPTEDVFFFPALVELEPNESMPVRVGTGTGFGSAEKSYSLFVHELAAGEDTAEVVPAASQTKQSIPIFVRPTKVAAAARIDELSVKKGHVRLQVRNTGTAHFRLRTIRLVGQTGDKEARWEQKVPAWYVLSGNVRAWDYELPPGMCNRLQRISVEFEGDEVGGRSSVMVPSEACPESAD